MQPADCSSDLKVKLKREMERFPVPHQVRLHRSISWLRRAEDERDDFDAQLIFLWIAFNAAYARELSHEQTERNRLSQFVGSLLSKDEQHRLRQLAMKQFSGPIRLLIENKFVFEPFWKALRDHDSSDLWETKFVASKKVALSSVLSGDVATVLSIVFDRLYVLRNQLIHGGATWNSSVNRAQVKDGASIMLAAVPLIIDLMLDQPDLDFGDIQYPVV